MQMVRGCVRVCGLAGPACCCCRCCLLPGCCLLLLPAANMCTMACWCGRVTGRGHIDINRISGYLPGKIVFFLMQVGVWWVAGRGGGWGGGWQQGWQVGGTGGVGRRGGKEEGWQDQEGGQRRGGRTRWGG